MIKNILSLFTLFIIHTANAQQNFQREITYQFHASMETKPDAILKEYFGSNKIKLRFKEKEYFDKEVLIVLLDSAIKYTVDTEGKTYRKKPLSINSTAKEQLKKTISGYSTTAFENHMTGLEGLFGGSMLKTSIVFYLADSLHYNIPSSLRGNAELIAIQENKIVLGADIIFNAGTYEVSDSAAKADIIKAEAIEIRPMIMNDDEFMIPADYVNSITRDHEPVPETTAVEKMPVATDTAVVKYPAKKKPTKKPAKPNKPKTTVKS